MTQPQVRARRHAVSASARAMLPAAVLVGLVLLAGCRAPEPTPPPPPPPPAAPPVARQPVPPPPDFCPELQRIVDAQADGFVALRGERLDERAWSGRVQPEGLIGCRIDGSSWPGAVYQCRVAGPRSPRGDGLVPAFDAFADRIDTCLARPLWSGRRWQRGQAMTLARGERLLQWHDNAILPRPILVLKIEEAIGMRRFDMLLRVETFR